MSRKTARDAAIKIIYALDVNDDFSEEFVGKHIDYFSTFDFDLERPPLAEDEVSFAKDVCLGYLSNSKRIDESISNASKDWDIDRLGRVDLAILRVSVYELIFRLDIPVSVIVNEAIENAKSYCKAESYKFINGVLGTIAKQEGRS